MKKKKKRISITMECALFECSLDRKQNLSINQ